MPLKAVYTRKPLMPLQQCPLRNGQVRTDDGEIRALYALCRPYTDIPELWEGAFALACMLTDAPLDEPVAKHISAALFRSAEGAFDGTVPEQIAVARAGMALYEYTADPAVLKRLASWCSDLELQWDSVIADFSVRTRPADLMELLVRIYRLSGIRAIPRICARLRSQAMDWTSVLNGFAQKQPLSAQLTAEDIDRLLREDGEDETAFSTRQYLISHAETLADGMRFSSASACFSGNGLELSAGEKGWEQISRFHGMPCGGTSADDLLAGKPTNRAMDAAALAAWAEAFCSCIPQSRGSWASDECIRLYRNALHAAIGSHGIIRYQRLNAFEADYGTLLCFHPDKNADGAVHTLARLARAFAETAKHAVMTTPRGFSVNMLIRGTYILRMGGRPFVLHAADDTITVRCHETYHGVAAVMADRWAADVRISVNENISYSVTPGSRNMIERDWRDRDTLKIADEGGPVLTEEHRHGAACMLGATLMALPVTADDYAWAVAGVPFLKDGRVYLPVRRIQPWKVSKNIPADIPVCPEAKGDIENKELKPYAGTPLRLAVLPRVRTE